MRWWWSRATSTLQTAKQKVEKYFGDIPAGPPVARQQAWIAKRTGSQRGVMQDRVPQARIYKVWNVPGWGTPEADYLNLLSDVLSSGKSSRLYKRLVYDDQIATDVSALRGYAGDRGTLRHPGNRPPGRRAGRVEKAVDEEVRRLLAGGPTAAELQPGQDSVPGRLHPRSRADRRLRR